MSYADMMFLGTIDKNGTGLGTVAPIMTMQSTGAAVAEQGCSGGTAAPSLSEYRHAPAVVSDDETQPAYTGADSKGPPHFPHNDAPLLSSLTLCDDKTGALLWNSGDITNGNANNGDSDFFAHTDSGVGKSGIVYILDSTQAGALDAMGFDFAKTRIGPSAFATGATGGQGFI